MTAITAITAQSTTGVSAVYPLPPEAIVEQVRAVADDIGVDAVKIGMVGTADAIQAVARSLELVDGAPVVLDPVMVAESGARLLDEDAIGALRSLLLPRASVATPNAAEAAVLAGLAPDTPPKALARAVHELELHAVGVVEEERVVPGRVVVLARLALDLRAALAQPAGALVHHLARGGRQREVVDAHRVAVVR